MNRKFNVLLILMALFSFSVLNAAVITFTGGGDGTTWEDPANWDTGTVPGFDDRAVIEGTSAVTLSTVAALNSIRVRNMSSLTINPSGVLLVNELDPMNDAVRISQNANVIVNGSLVVINSRRNGIEIRGNGTLMNNNFVNVVSSRFEGIYMIDNATLINNNVLFIQGSDQEDCMDMEDDAEFINMGTANMSNADNEILEMDDNSSVDNQGTLNLSGADDNDAICMDDNGTFFSNTGMINISDIIDEGEGIEVDDGEFHNESTGTINMNNVTGDAFKIEDDGEFINDGSVNINAAPENDEQSAIEIEDDGLFTNNNIVNIWMTGVPDADAIDLESGNSDLDNTLCGVINIISEHKINIDAGGEIDNQGVIATNFGGVNENDGTFNNDGQINAPNGFMIAPNALVGGGTVNMAGAVPAQSACNINIGAIGCGGNTTYNAAQDTYTQTADGCYYVGGYATDEISYAFQELCGNGEIIARVASFVGQGWGGVMMREDLSPGSRKVSLMMNQSQVARREVRVSPGGSAFPQQFPAYGYSWVRLVRNGNYFQGYISQNGFNWQFVMNQFVPMQNCIHIGLVSTNYNQFNSTSTVIFDNVFFSSAPLATPDVPEGGLDIAFEELTEESISVYPNPTSGMLSIELYSSRDEVMDIKVMNSLGQPVKSLAVNPAESFREEVDLSGLASGMYYIHFQKADGETQIERVVLNANK